MSKDCKKIGMIPLLYDENNYGGVLQFYALKRIIHQMGYSIEIVRMKNNQLVCKQNPSIKVRLKRPLITLYRSTIGVMRKKKISNAISGRCAKIELFRSAYSKGEVLKKADDSFDEFCAIVCGSDQIWNPSWATRRTLLADIPDSVNKIIYAASMGCEEMEEYERNAFKPLVERIQHVSVREESAKKLLDSFVNRNDIQVVLDPTLLLTPDQWCEIAKKPSIDEKYIFTYFLGDCSSYLSVVKRAAKENGLKIVNIPYASGESVDTNIFGDYKIFDASPEEFLGWISNAEIVFTDSFHACVFSTLFKRKYFVFERKGSTNMIGRIVTLQNNFHLSGRIIKPEDNIDYMQQVDYSLNDVYQSKLMHKSYEFLEKSIKDGISK